MTIRLIVLVAIGLNAPGLRLLAAQPSVSAPPASIQDDHWMEDIEQAIRLAETDGRDMLILFTGSDWCPPCMKLEQETLSQADFLRQAARDWLLVKCDFPRTRGVPPDIERANEHWKDHFGIPGFPTIVLTDSARRPIGFVGYVEGGPVAMLEQLRTIKEHRVRRDEALAEAETAEGNQQAALLDRALSAVGEDLAKVWYTDLIDRIVALDEDNRLGLREKWNGERDAETRACMRADIDAVARLDRPERAIAFIDEVLQSFRFPANEEFAILQIKLGLLQQAGQTAAAQTLLDQMLALPGITDQARESLLVRKAYQQQAAGDAVGARAGLEEALASGADLPMVRLALAQLRALAGERDAALAMLEESLPRAARRPDALVEIVAAIAELQCAAGRDEEGLGALESFAADEQVPVDLRAEALLHAALIMRDAGRLRPAMLTENRAVALARDPETIRELQRVVDAIRRRASDPNTPRPDSSRATGQWPRP